MTIEELAKRKVELRQYLEAMQYMNVYGVPSDDLIQREIVRIEKQKELFRVDGEIKAYIEAA